jgi:DNA-binding transcriptional LysR family regulator
MPAGGIVNVSLRLLRAFVAVSREGNVGRAAAGLYVSQPALSQDIRRLERELGVVLFDRGPRGMTPTAAGERLLRGVESGLTAIDAAVADARAVAGGDRVTIRVAYSPSVGNRLMPALLPVIERELGDIEIDEREVGTGEVGPGVVAGRFDAGLAHCPSADPALVISRILDEPLCVAVADRHRLAGRESVRLEELTDSTLLIWRRDSAPEYFDEIVAVCRRAGVRLRGITEVPRLTPRSYLLDDSTFSLLPRSAAAIPRPEVTFVALADPACTVPLTYLRRAGDDRDELRSIETLTRVTSALLEEPLGA